MVDLAGSERSSKTGTEGAIAKEALYINKSLSFLEQVLPHLKLLCNDCQVHLDVQVPMLASLCNCLVSQNETWMG